MGRNEQADFDKRIASKSMRGCVVRVSIKNLTLLV